MQLIRNISQWRNIRALQGLSAAPSLSNLSGLGRNLRMPRLPHFGSIRARIPAFALIALYTYLAFHAFSGSQGVIRWMDYAERKDSLQTKLTALETQRAALEAQVKALKADGLDLDVLDIEARKSLYVSDTKELTIWLDPQR